MLCNFVVFNFISFNVFDMEFMHSACLFVLNNQLYTITVFVHILESFNFIFNFGTLAVLIFIYCKQIFWVNFLEK